LEHDLKGKKYESSRFIFSNPYSEKVVIDV